MWEAVLVGAGVDVEALQHPCEHRLALSAAGGVELSVMAYHAFGRRSPPEFGHAEGLQSVHKGILQELGCTAVASAAWR